MQSGVNLMLSEFLLEVNITMQAHGSLPVPDVVGSATYGSENTRVRSAPADVPVHGLHDLCIVGILVRAEKRDSREDHAGSAVSTLKSLFAKEGLLHRVQ